MTILDKFPMAELATEIRELQFRPPQTLVPNLQWISFENDGSLLLRTQLIGLEEALGKFYNFIITFVLGESPFANYSVTLIIYTLYKHT